MIATGRIGRYSTVEIRNQRYYIYHKQDDFKPAKPQVTSGLSFDVSMLSRLRGKVS